MPSLTATSIEQSLPSSLPLRRPEILAPAGDWECARAAVENGADAIYFGLERFNARMRATNLTAGRPAAAHGLSPPAGSARLRHLQHARLHG